MLHPSQRPSRPLRGSALAGLVLVLVSTLAPASSAGNRAVHRLVPLSGATPFPAGCGVPGEPTPDSEAEPHIAVDPLDPDHLVAVWQQDRFAVDGGALTNLAAVSEDGGRSWTTVHIPGISACTGGTDERTSDPWVSIGGDGTVYLASLTFSETPINPFVAGPTQQVVSRSFDGGYTWEPPVAVQPFDGGYNDRESLTADPARPGHAYHVFVKRYGAFGESGNEMFALTTDGGATWSAPRPIFVAPTGTLTDPVLIDVLPDGTLLNVFLLANLTPFLPDDVPRVPWEVMAQRSTDLGLTWSAPVTIAAIAPSAPVDPDTGTIVRAYDVISLAVGPDGVAYVVWNEIQGLHAGRVFLSRSGDGGISWSAPVTVADVPAQAFLPNVAVSTDGTVAVTWDDFRGDVPMDGRLTTRVRVAWSRDGGTTWDGRPIGGPFDILTGPETDSSGVSGLFVGDYQGLVGLARGRFGAVFAETRPAATAGPSDVVFARIRTRR